MINYLSNEFELIQDDRLREFAVEAVSAASEYGDENTANYIKRVVHYIDQFSEVIEAEDKIKDMIIVAGLIHSLEFDEIHPHLKPLSLKIYLSDLMPLVGRETYDNIMFVIARQMGFQTVYPEFEPKIDDVIHVWLLPLAIKLAKSKEN